MIIPFNIPKPKKTKCKFKKGDKIIYRTATGTIITEPEYITSPSSGLWYADVKWDTGFTDHLCLNYIGIKKRQ